MTWTWTSLSNIQYPLLFTIIACSWTSWLSSLSLPCPAVQHSFSSSPPPPSSYHSPPPLPSHSSPSSSSPSPSISPSSSPILLLLLPCPAVQRNKSCGKTVFGKSSIFHSSVIIFISFLQNSCVENWTEKTVTDVSPSSASAPWLSDRALNSKRDKIVREKSQIFNWNIERCCSGPGTILTPTGFCTKNWHKNGPNRKVQQGSTGRWQFVILNFSLASSWTVPAFCPKTSFPHYLFFIAYFSAKNLHVFVDWITGYFMCTSPIHSYHKCCFFCQFWRGKLT